MRWQHRTLWLIILRLVCVLYFQQICPGEDCQTDGMGSCVTHRCADKTIGFSRVECRQKGSLYSLVSICCRLLLRFSCCLHIGFNPFQRSSLSTKLPLFFNTNKIFQKYETWIINAIPQKFFLQTKSTPGIYFIFISGIITN
jgi:hypothetical protein